LINLESWPGVSAHIKDSLNVFYNKKRVLVTGGASFIGSHLVDALLTLGSKVTVIDDFSSGLLENLPINHNDLEIINLDIFISSDISKYFDSIDYVFHLAAIHGGRGFIEKYPQETLKNLGIDTKVFQTSVESGVKRVVHASSACAYPISQQSLIGSEHILSEEYLGSMEEEGALPDGTYGWTKLIGEYQLKKIIQGSQTSGRSARIFTAYGERENESHAAIALIAKGLLKLDPYIIWGTGLQTRNFTYVTDTVLGLLLCATDTGKAKFEIINIGTSEHVTINEFVEVIFEKLLWRPTEIYHDLSKPTGVASRASNNNLILKKFRWEPKVTIREGLERTIEWYSKNEKRPKTISELEKFLESR